MRWPLGINDAARRARVVRVLTAIPVTAFCFVYADRAATAWDLPSLLHPVVALSIGLALTMPPVALYQVAYSADYGIARAPPGVATTFVAADVIALDLVIAASGVPPRFTTSVRWLVGFTVLVWLTVYAIERRIHDGLMYRPLETTDPEAAEELAERCWTALSDQAMDPDKRAIVAANLASALRVLSSRVEYPDFFPDAIEALDDTLAATAPDLAYRAAGRMVEVMAGKYDRATDTDGYEDALAALRLSADGVAGEIDDAIGSAIAARAAWLDRLAVTGAVEQARAAIAELRSAVDALPAGSPSHVYYTAVLAHRAAEHPDGRDLDAAVRDCGRAVRRLGFGNDEWRARAMLMLADVLQRRAVRQPHGRALAVGDLLAALVVLRRASRIREFAAEARRRRPELYRRLADVEAGGLSRFFARRAPQLYERVFREQLSISATSAGDIADSWRVWATCRGDVVQAAQAGWCWINAISDDLRRRVVTDKETRIGRIQGQVAETADALVRAKRLRDAAVALDMGRAFVLTERMDRDRNGLFERLVQAGHAELAEAWLEVREWIQQEDRARFAPSAGAGFRQASDEYLALTSFDRLLRTIAALPGFEDVDDPPDFDDLRAGASEGPLVYLVAAEQRSLALIVTAEPEPVLVELVGADRAQIAALVDELGAPGRRRERARRLDAALVSLHERIVSPVAAHLPPGTLVTLIAGGALAALPLHIAGATPDEDGIWRDRTNGLVFRYAPNARVLRRAQHTRRAIDDEDLRVLTASVVFAPGWTDLPHASAESAGVHASFPPERVEWLDDATVAGVERYLADCSVWHFACHGEYVPLSPLDSHLKLADGPLTLRSLFAHPVGSKRLAVLSACHSATLDSALPDEVIGFPSAMLQAGFAGVVACHSAVDDYAAMLLVRDFFRCFADTGTPARALAEAQAWLRAATNAELRAAFPHIHGPGAFDLDDLDEWSAYRPFKSPSSWGLFSYTGA